MTKQLKEIEIPFGAKDSELCDWEYTIPEGMEATIVDNKIVVKKKDSGDERIRKALLNEFIHLQSKGYKFAGLEGEEIVAWIEKQGEQISMNKTECIIYGLKTEFQKQVSYLIASVMNGEHEYTQGYVEWVSQSLLGFAKNEMKYVEWSKKDKEMIEKCLQTINHDRIIHVPKGGDSFHQEEIDWLKSLKGRVQPHNTWKPSEEQIKVCKEVYADLLSAKGFDLGTVNGELNRMEEQLKKLKE